MSPWEGEIKIKKSIMVEAKIIDEDNTKKKPSVAIKENRVKKPIIEKKLPKKDIKLTKEHLERFMEKNGTLDKKIQNIILEKCIAKAGDSNLNLLFKELYNYYKNGKS